MEFWKFAAMLKDGSLHFSRVDRFQDKFEGSYPINNLPKYPKLNDPKLTYEAYKKYVAVSCWHENTGESEAMWQLYLARSVGVAIVSSKERLEEYVQSKGLNISIIEIKYIDFLHDSIDDFSWFKAFEYKRKCFEHEREIRATIYSNPLPEKFINGFPEYGLPDGTNCIPEAGEDVEIDLSKLIEKVVLCPKSGSWFKSLVGDLLKKYSWNFQVEESELSRDPVFPNLFA